LLTTFDPVVVAAVAGCGSASAVIDLRIRRVPNKLTLGIAALGVLIAVTNTGAVSVGAAFAGLGVGLAIMLPSHIIGATGAGDVKLFAALGTLLGPWGIVTAFAYTAIAGGVLALAVALSRRRLRDTIERTAWFVRTRGANVAEIESASSDNRFAYAPAIALGALVAALGI
jgi:prepilin peptidase CpaA